MNATITLPSQLYNYLLKKSRQLKRTPDELVINLVQQYLHHDQWQTQFKSLLARIQSKTTHYPSAEIEDDITLAAQEARQLRHDRRSA